MSQECTISEVSALLQVGAFIFPIPFSLQLLQPQLTCVSLLLVLVSKGSPTFSAPSCPQITESPLYSKRMILTPLGSALQLSHKGISFPLLYFFLSHMKPAIVHVLAITVIPSVDAVSALPILLERCVTNVHQITGAITLSVAARWVDFYFLYVHCLFHSNL